MAMTVLLAGCADAESRGDGSGGRGGSGGGAGGGGAGGGQAGGGAGGGGEQDAPVDPGGEVGAGKPCTAGGECGTGFCTDGYCCELACKGVCQSCGLAGKEGTCWQVKNAPDPDTCADPMSCGPTGVCKKGNGAPCSTMADCSSALCQDGVCCDKACTTPCLSCKTGTCTPVMDGDDPECMGGKCDAMGVCKKPDGLPCTSAVDCTSGFCADGVCCNEACTGVCRSCKAPAAGICTNVPAGMDPDNDCAAGCNTATCTTSTGSCDGMGACAGSVSCGAYSCYLGTACRTSCISNSYCCTATGRVCAEGGLAALSCGATDTGRATALSYDNLTFSGLCALEVGSDRPATSVWSGYEYVYRFTAAASQTVEFTATRTAGNEIDLFVFVAESCTAAVGCCTTITGCEGSAHTATDAAETASISVAAGTTYYVVVDTVITTGTATFNLAVTCL